MPIDLTKERAGSFTALAKELPRIRAGKSPNPSTLWRWYKSGVRGVRLETCFVGGMRCTTREAIDRFFATINGQDLPRPQSPERHQDAVEQELQSLGA
jgi:hypothetical protein